MVETATSGSSAQRHPRSGGIVDESEATSDLAVRAAHQALERANLVPEDIDFIVVGTTTPDMFFPSTGNIVQHRLGCRRVGSVDVLAACAASIYSLIIGARFIEAGKYRRVLCIGAETLSRITDFTIAAPACLLADAAGAAVLEATRTGRIPRRRSLLRRPVLGFALHAGGRLAHARDGGDRGPAPALREDEGQRGLQGRGAPCSSSPLRRSSTGTA